MPKSLEPSEDFKKKMMGMHKGMMKDKDKKKSKRRLFEKKEK